MSIHEVPFLAPVPRGHELVLVTFSFGEKSPTLVFDKTASTIYCPQILWGPLLQDSRLAVTDPIAVVTRYAWTVQSSLRGVCAGAILSTEQRGELHEVKTMLVVEPSPTPYR